MKRLNRYLIKVLENDPDVRNVEWVFFGLIAFASFVIEIILLRNGFINVKNFGSVLSTWFICFIIIMSFYVIFTSPFSLLLHHILPRKEQRDTEIASFKAAQLEKSKIIKNFFDSYIDQLKSDPDSFLKEHFQFSQSFKRFFLERVFFDGEVIEEKVFLLLLIPRKKTMPIDSLREIILSLNFIGFDINEWELKDFFMDSDKLNDHFSDLTIEQIKLIFTRTFDPEDYQDLLVSLKGTNIKLLPANNLLDLMRFSPSNVTREERLRHTYLPKIKNHLSREYSLKILLTYSDFYNASQFFSNCVRSYANAESDVFTLTRARIPVACVEVDKNRIVQISGYKNEKVSGEVKKMITEAFNKAKSS